MLIIVAEIHRALVMRDGDGEKFGREFLPPPGEKRLPWV